MKRAIIFAAMAMGFLRPALADEDYTRLLPAAPDSNYFLSSPFSLNPQLGDSYTVLEYAAEPLEARIGGNGSLAAIYDTGFMDGDFGPSSVALDGTDAAHRRANFSMSGFEASGKLLWDVQKTGATTGVRSQAQVELEYREDMVRTRNAYVRVAISGQEIAAGQLPSYISDQNALPVSVMIKGVAPLVLNQAKAELFYSVEGGDLSAQD